MIFLSYRRNDSIEIVGHIHERLKNRFGEENVFVDTDSVPDGVDLRDYIEEKISQSKIVLIVIGPNWIGASEGQPNEHWRISNPADLVRYEAEKALEYRIPILPILTGSTRMPDPRLLPESLVDITFKAASNVSAGQDFNVHMIRLIESIEKITEYPTIETKKRVRKTLIYALLSVSAVAIVLQALYWMKLFIDNETKNRGEITLSTFFNAEYPENVGFIDSDLLVPRVTVNGKLVDTEQSEQGAISTSAIIASISGHYDLEVEWYVKRLLVAKHTNRVKAAQSIVVKSDDYDYAFDYDKDGINNIVEFDYDTGPKIRDNTPEIVDLGFIGKISQADTVGMSLLVLFDTYSFDLDISLQQPNGYVASANRVDSGIGYIPYVGAVFEEAGCKGAQTVRDLNDEEDYRGEMIRYFEADTTRPAGEWHLRVNFKAACKPINSSYNRSFKIIANNYIEEKGQGRTIFEATPSKAILESTEQVFDMRLLIIEN